MDHLRIEMYRYLMFLLKKIMAKKTLMKILPQVTHFFSVVIIHCALELLNHTLPCSIACTLRFHSYHSVLFHLQPVNAQDTVSQWTMMWLCISARYAYSTLNQHIFTLLSHAPKAKHQQWFFFFFLFFSFHLFLEKLIWINVSELALKSQCAISE